MHILMNRMVSIQRKARFAIKQKLKMIASIEDIAYQSI